MPLNVEEKLCINHNCRPIFSPLCGGLLLQLPVDYDNANREFYHNKAEAPTFMRGSNEMVAPSSRRQRTRYFRFVNDVTIASSIIPANRRSA